MTVLPGSLVDVLRSQVERAAEIHRQDLRDGFRRVDLPFARAKKYPSADREDYEDAVRSSCNGSGPRPDSPLQAAGSLTEFGHGRGKSGLCPKTRVIAHATTAPPSTT